MGDTQRFPSPPAWGQPPAMGPRPCPGLPSGPQGQPQCTDVHQYAPVYTSIPSHDKGCDTPPRQQIPWGHLGKPPPSTPPLNFFARSEQHQPLAPSQRAPSTTGFVPRCKAHPAAGREVTPVGVPRGGSSPRKVLEMYSETWFPERLVSERCVSSRFSILLNCGQQAGLSGAGGKQDPPLPVPRGSVVQGYPPG